MLRTEALYMAKLYPLRPITLMSRSLVLGQVTGTENLVPGQVLRMEPLYLAIINTYTCTWPGHKHGSLVIGPEAL